VRLPLQKNSLDFIALIGAAFTTGQHIAGIMAVARLRIGFGAYGRRQRTHIRFACCGHFFVACLNRCGRAHFIITLTAVLAP
jgi:putative copper export protein